jgi:hypothetical protein
MRQEYHDDKMKESETVEFKRSTSELKEAIISKKKCP